MTERHKQEVPVEEVNVKIKDAREGHTHFSHYVLAGSILLGAILVSFSIFYNVKIVLKRLDAGSSGNVVAAADQQNPSAPSAAPDGGPTAIPADRSDAPLIGNKDAKVTIMEFSDFQCPFCAKFFKESFSSIKSKYVDTGKVKLIYRNLPLPMHANAQKAAEAGECANRQGKFEQYYEVLFNKGQSDGTGLGVADLKKYAKDLGLNTSKFNQCLDNGEAVAAVKADSDAASAAGVSGTPTLFINGKKIVGAQPLATFEQAIEDALKN